MAELEYEIAQLIRQYQEKTGNLLTIGSVESATGGRISDRITSISGSSDYYKGSIIAYSNEIKTDIVGVKQKTLENHGAVSAKTAIEMAVGGRKLLFEVGSVTLPAPGHRRHDGPIPTAGATGGGSRRGWESRWRRLRVAHHSVAEPHQGTSQANPRRRAPPCGAEGPPLFRSAQRILYPLLGHPQCNLLIDLHECSPLARCRLRHDVPRTPARAPDTKSRSGRVSGGGDGAASPSPRRTRRTCLSRRF